MTLDGTDSESGRSEDATRRLVAKLCWVIRTEGTICDEATLYRKECEARETVASELQLIDANWRESEAVRNAALEMIALLEPKVDRVTYTYRFSDKNYRVRCGAAHALGLMRYPGAISSLIQAMMYDCSHAGWALREIDDPSAVPQTIRMLAQHGFRVPNLEGVGKTLDALDTNWRGSEPARAAFESLCATAVGLTKELTSAMGLRGFDVEAELATVAKGLALLGDTRAIGVLSNANSTMKGPLTNFRQDVMVSLAHLRRIQAQETGA